MASSSATIQKLDRYLGKQPVECLNVRSCLPRHYDKQFCDRLILCYCKIPGQLLADLRGSIQLAQLHRVVLPALKAQVRVQAGLEGGIRSGNLPKGGGRQVQEVRQVIVDDGDDLLVGWVVQPLVVVRQEGQERRWRLRQQGKAVSCFTSCEESAARLLLSLSRRAVAAAFVPGN